MVTQDVYLKVNAKQAYVKVFEVSKEAPNVIFIMTPIVTVNDPLSTPFLEGLAGSGCNVFALDFLGIGSSEGTAADIVYSNFKAAVMELIGYIGQNYSQAVHFYGGTGTGGILGQALCSDEDIGRHISSYIQFGVGIHGDLSAIGNTALIKASYPLIRMLGKYFPGKKLKFKVPSYTGYNAEKENAWYEETMKKYPGAFDLQLSLLSLILGLHLDGDSPMRQGLKCPVLVLASLHDRYFKREYIERYFNALTSAKRIIWYEDSHLAFYWRAKEMNGEVAAWIEGLERQVIKSTEG